MFTTDIDQDVLILKWNNEHECKYRQEDGNKYVGAIGGSLTYCFTPTGLGTIIKVKCSCGDEIDVTNYDEF